MKKLHAPLAWVDGRWQRDVLLTVDAGGHWAEIAVNTALSCVPTIVTAAMITTAISAAISPYSMAVTPSSSRANF